MAKSGKQLANPSFTMSGSFAEGELVFTGARITDRMSSIGEMRIEFLCTTSDFDPESILGTRLTLSAVEKFKFRGICIAVEDLGHDEGYDRYAAEVRPWLWCLTMSSENRIFQGKSTPEILTDVFAGIGISDVRKKLSGSYPARDYCVQYGESNFAFVSRLMEEDGIYYYFDYEGATEVLVLADSVGAHSHVGLVEFKNRAEETRVFMDSMFEWAEHDHVVTGKVSLFDYNLTSPNADLRVTSAIAKGRHAYKAMERYQASGHYLAAQAGESRARTETEGYAGGALRFSGICNAPGVRPGAIFTLGHFEEAVDRGRYLVLGCTHYLQPEGDDDDDDDKDSSSGKKKTKTRSFVADDTKTVQRIAFPEGMILFQTEFEVTPDAVPFRAPKTTPWPALPGLQTALVTGPSGDEIYTDEHGRIKVQFHWDRAGKKDENTSCWVRCVMPWGGKDWGMFSVPRIGQEVVIQFERGNIDRPYCTGVVYNSVNKPPYPLPAEMTKTGLRTNSSKGGGGFHELTFDDKKDAETVFFQSEKDYTQKIKNNAVITIGMEKKDKGDLTQTIYRHKTELLETGDLTQTVKDGNRTVVVKKDDKETIDGTSTVTIKGNTTWEISEGNLTEEVKKGNMSTTVSVGNVALETKAGKIEITAATEILLKVGANTIKISQSGIEIKGTMITAQGSAKVDVSAPKVKVEGSGMVQVQSGGIAQVQGSMVKIN